MIKNNVNREHFLHHIAAQLGRPRRTHAEPLPKYQENYAVTRLSDLNQDQLCQALIDYVTTQTVHCVVSLPEDVTSSLIALCEKYGGGPIILSHDHQLQSLNLPHHLSEKFQTHLWQPELGDKNIEIAKHAKIGIVFAEAGLAESGGVVLYSSAEKARSISLLPECSIFILRKSTILPRVAQLAEQLHQRSKQGERMPYCINIIGGASSTADIELIKVFGVHGPIYAAYLIIDDC